MVGSRRKTALVVLVLWVLCGVVGPGVHAVQHAGDASPPDQPSPQWVAEDLHVTVDCALCNAVFESSKPAVLSLSGVLGPLTALMPMQERETPRAVRYTAHSRGPPLAGTHA
ncbi:MAG: hypothetical protein GVY15_02615 [Bacteroidetes bacterium]|jgi:hypothetical protein|nr:hypothetical protein [Bacteroidota bacterium]